MKRAIIKPDICNNCDPCLVEKSCPNTAVIREASDEKPWIDFYRCCGCMKCMGYCKNKATQEIYHPCDGKAKKGW